MFSLDACEIEMLPLEALQLRGMALDSGASVVFDLLEC